MPKVQTGLKNTVLLVDDNMDNLELLRAIFGSAGFQVFIATSVAEARSILANKTFIIDLVLSDISMPVETGFDLLVWMRSAENKQDHLPVLLITAALPEDENRIKGLSLGAVDYIVRPINNQELILRVRNALEHHKQFRSLQRSLETSEDMAMTGRILAAANHEIRNIVGLIKISSEQALASAERGEIMKPGSYGFQCLSSLSSTTNLLTQISRDLNSHINAERIHTVPCNIRALIEDVLSLTMQKLKGLHVETDGALDHYFVMADATRVKQILVNFIFNAIDAISEKGLLSSGRIEVKITENSPDTLQIRVKDNGIGLINARRQTTFEPFQTTKAVRGGKGLGLWLCSRLAQAMGGTIYLESKGPGLGATSVIELRRCAPPVQDDFTLEDYFI